MVRIQTWKNIVYLLKINYLKQEIRFYVTNLLLLLVCLSFMKQFFKFLTIQFLLL